MRTKKKSVAQVEAERRAARQERKAKALADHAAEAGLRAEREAAAAEILRQRGGEL